MTKVVFLQNKINMVKCSPPLSLLLYTLILKRYTICPLEGAVCL